MYKFDGYSKKIISIDKALSLVKTGDCIVSALGACEAQLFFTNLHKVVEKGVTNINVNNCLQMCRGEYLTNPIYQKHFDIDSWFYNADLRKLQGGGNINYIPCHLQYCGSKRLSHIKPNIYIGAATMPDKHGYVSLSLSNTYEKQAIAKSDIIILEINPNYPRTFGDVEMHVSEVDYFIEANYAVPEIPDVEPSELDFKIGKLIASEINDGDCLQLGIGGMPNGIAKSLYNKKDLGIHTEMLTSEVARLAKSGVINGRKKNFMNGKIVCTFALGSKELYDFVDNNTGVAFMDGTYVNDITTISKNDNQVSINSAIECDLTGQCASESVGVRQISGTGGQADTAIGAQKSKNGKSYICLYSTATVKNKDGSLGKISTIVPRLNQGAVVSLSRNDVDRVVTEYGIAELRGTNIRERVERLVAIAHPDFRDDLMCEAYKLQIINKRY